MTLRSLIDETEPAAVTIAVLGSDGSVPLEAMLTEMFATQSIDVETGVQAEAADLAGWNGLEAYDASEEAIAILLDEGVPVAASSMMELYDAILAINSDLFTTGARGLGEVELPDVLASLEDTRLRLRGYPLAHKEKLLLILVSRFIEQVAWKTGQGTVRSSFQTLSRIDDEVGTRAVYDELSATAVDVHVYGVDDGEVPPSLDATVHAGSNADYRDGWFVVFRPDDPDSAEASALVCLETDPRIWDGFWTTDPDRVAAIEDAIARRL
ncbi:DICT sensory domain-containing protein [Natronorubrum sp. DTA7]|uniref:DICT sensory domain-containing protein n=1 Tax=Natronorubrum sp. DTA7 TaxID=3447016 RepID=UPI003F87E375